MALGAALFHSVAAFASAPGGFEMSILVDGSTRPEYSARGTVYVEAIRGREYAIRLTNPLPYRVAVALSVDGLNSVDAKRTDARSAAKWVLDPYETTVITGWQVSDSAARRFYFTGESRSYGAFLGQTQNLGVIEAVFFKEKQRIPPPIVYRNYDRDYRRDAPGAGSGRAEEQGSAAEGKEQQAPSASSAAPYQEKSKRAAPAPKLEDEYAATGMGDRTQHEVSHVDLRLEDRPAATVRIRYEFHQQLVKLGVLPRELERPPLARREGASGFQAYCPQPGVR